MKRFLGGLAKNGRTTFPKSFPAISSLECRPMCKKLANAGTRLGLGVLGKMKLKIPISKSTVFL
jgi:hypothetical protein